MSTRANPGPQREFRHEALRVGIARCARSSPYIGLALAALITSAPLLAAGDEGDASYVHPLVNQALETEKTDVEIPWANPETGNRGVIVVERTFYRDEQPCRDYRRTVQEPGSPAVVIEGTGCRVGPGHWELEEEPAKKTSAEKATAVAPAAGPARQQPEPERSARAAPPSATAAPETKAELETEAASEKASAEPATTAEDTPQAAPPKPPPFPSYTMPSPASL